MRCSLLLFVAVFVAQVSAWEIFGVADNVGSVDWGASQTVRTFSISDSGEVTIHWNTTFKSAPWYFRDGQVSTTGSEKLFSLLELPSEGGPGSSVYHMASWSSTTGPPVLSPVDILPATAGFPFHAMAFDANSGQLFALFCPASSINGSATHLMVAASPMSAFKTVPWDSRISLFSDSFLCSGDFTSHHMATSKNRIAFLFDMGLALMDLNNSSNSRVNQNLYIDGQVTGIFFSTTEDDILFVATDSHIYMVNTTDELGETIANVPTRPATEQIFLTSDQSTMVFFNYFEQPLIYSLDLNARIPSWKKQPLSKDSIKLLNLCDSPRDGCLDVMQLGMW